MSGSAFLNRLWRMVTLYYKQNIFLLYIYYYIYVLYIEINPFKQEMHKSILKVLDVYYCVLLS